MAVSSTAPVFGPLTMSVSTANVVTGTFTMTALDAPPSAASRSRADGCRAPVHGRAAGHRCRHGVTFSGTRTFRFSSATLAAGGYVARPAVLLNGPGSTPPPACPSLSRCDNRPDAPAPTATPW
jgi:hypothetical protein